MSILRTITVLITVVALSTPVTAGAQSDAESERDDVQRRQAEVASEIDVLEASDAEIDRALDDLDAAIAVQRTDLDEAEGVRTATRDDLRDAEANLVAARRDVTLLQEAIRQMAVASYIHPPTADLVLSLQAASFSDALLQRSYLDARARRDLDLLDLLELAEQTAVARADDVERAADAAVAAVDAAAAALEGLRQEQARQQAFAGRLQERIDAALAESAVLAELDAELADEIAAQQAALLARIPPPPPPAPPSQPQADVPPPTTTTTTTIDSGADTPEEGDASDSDVRPTNTPSRTSRTTVPVRTVQGITVHVDIADDIDALLDAASADGVDLSGWGYRSSASQIALREAHCGSTDYDIWERPAGSCSPPTAIPGRSMHERGLAIDFTYSGRTITSRSNPGYVWLAANASSYGLRNLPSEPWHWSTNGS